jgi:hypothetical protein
VLAAVPLCQHLLEVAAEVLVELVRDAAAERLHHLHHVCFITAAVVPPVGRQPLAEDAEGE